MVVPYANRAGVATLPALALALKPASVKEIIEDFAKQCPHETALECVQLIKGRTLRVIFPSAIIMEDIILPPKVDTTAKPPPIRRVPQPVETVERDRSPLTTTSSSQSDSSGEVSPPKTTATTHPPRPPSEERGERDRSPIRPRRARAPLDRRPVSTRTRELRVGDSSLSEEEAATEIDRIERVEQQLNAKKQKRREVAALTLQHSQLLLDYAFASQAYMAKQSSNEDTTEITDFLVYAKEALDAFGVEHPHMAGTSK